MEGSYKQGREEGRLAVRRREGRNRIIEVWQAFAGLEN